jgi:hypothetical protein
MSPCERKLRTPIVHSAISVAASGRISGNGANIEKAGDPAVFIERLRAINGNVASTGNLSRGRYGAVPISSSGVAQREAALASSRPDGGRPRSREAYNGRMIEIDHRRAIAASLIHDAAAMLVKAQLKDLDPSDKTIVPGALKKLAIVAKSLSSTNPLGDDDAAAKLTAVATALMNCNNPDLKRSAYSEVVKAAKIFDALSQGL